MADRREDEEVEISPTIRGDKVVRLVVCGLEWPLRAEIPVEEFLKVAESIRLLARYVDLAQVAPGPAEAPMARARASWSEEELARFLEERSEAQKAFLRILAERGEVVREEVLQAIRSELGRPDYGGGDLAGLVAGINRRVNSLRKEPLFTIERRRLGGRLAGIYKVNPRYRELLLRLLGAQAL